MESKQLPLNKGFTMKMMKGFIIAIIMTTLAIGIASARAEYTPETATRAFVEAAMEGNIERMTWPMTDDAAAFLILYADANKIKNVFSKKGGITKIEQVSNDGKTAVTKVTFRDGSAEQFKLIKGNYDWLITSQTVKRN